MGQGRTCGARSYMWGKVVHVGQGRTCGARSYMWGKVVQWLERPTPVRQDRSSIPLGAVSKLGQFHSINVAPVHSAV